MERVIRKVFFVWQMEAEQKWLEGMAKKGYILKKLGLFKYIFDVMEPQDLVYQFDFQILHKKTEPEYLDLFKDWKLIDRFGSWYYFSKERSISGNEIYSNNESKMEMLNRVLIFFLIVGFPLYYQLLIMFPNMNSGKLEYPNFYFFFRILVIIFTGLHLFAFMNVLLAYRSFRNSLKE